LAAATILQRANGITLSIKFCLEHIFHNVVHKFKIGKDKLGRLRNTMSAMQASFELALYAQATDKLVRDFGNETGCKITVYLMSIHPRHWVVFANRCEISDDDWMPGYLTRLQQAVRSLGIVAPDDLGQVHLHFIDSTVPIGKQFPLFGISRNNMSEGGASHVNGLGIRSMSPLFALDRFLLNAKKTLVKYRQEIEEIDPSQIPFTSIGVKLFQDSTRDDSIEVVTTIMDQATDGLFNLQLQLGRKVYNVQMTRYRGSCDCRRHSMYNCLCQHTRKAITHLVNCGMIDLTQAEQKVWVVNNMPQCLVVARVKLFLRTDTAFSFCGMVDDLPTPVTDTVYPPPRYTTLP
jgi:hypothetical protein